MKYVRGVACTVSATTGLGVAAGILMGYSTEESVQWGLEISPLSLAVAAVFLLWDTPPAAEGDSRSRLRRLHERLQIPDSRGWLLSESLGYGMMAGTVLALTYGGSPLFATALGVPLGLAVFAGHVAGKPAGSE